MSKKIKNKKIIKILKTNYKDVKTELYYNNTFQLLISTILSAQCTDKQVNKVTKKLFTILKTPEDFSKASIKKIENLIRSTGFYHNKAKHIKNCSHTLLLKHNGQVPDNMEELITLPGVGRKTANVVLNVAYSKGNIVVDTHVKRISKRLGLTESDDPFKIEFDLMKIIPKKEWITISLRFIYHGRKICKARKPLCNDCPLFELCDLQTGT